MAKEILNVNQRKILQAIGQEKFLVKQFYLTGGTALSAFYLKHRYSEDLDFFSEREFEPQSIAVLLKSWQKKLGIKKVSYEQSFNRYLFFLHLKNKNDVIKMEFTYFPFTPLQKGKVGYNVKIDSLLDIAVNKLFTIYQKPRSRDFIDLYFIIKKKKWTVNELIKKAKVKFDWHIEPIQLGSQFTQVSVLKDYPRLVKKISHKAWQEFFIQEAKRLGKNILK